MCPTTPALLAVCFLASTSRGTRQHHQERGECGRREGILVVGNAPIRSDHGLINQKCSGAMSRRSRTNNISVSIVARRLVPVPFVETSEEYTAKDQTYGLGGLASDY